jgi:mono/diheme cytochrome c family protein
MNRPLAFALLFASFGALANPFPNGDAAAGKRLFEQNDCNSCHIGKVGGDGNAIFTRPNHIVHSPEQLVARMHVCSGATGMTLTPRMEQDLGAYLNQAYYRFK